MTTALTFSPGDRIVGARSRRTYTLARLIGHGGEGDVFALQERPGFLAKLYRKPVDRTLAGKLDYLASRQVPKLKSFTAWPEEVITSARGGAAGFIMPAIDGAKPLHQLITPKSRLQNFPQASYRYLVTVASNLARALSEFHNEDLVVGDLNGKNVLVRPDATVRFIDVDSIQVGNGRRYLCPVGVPEYTPPELQGRSLAHARRSQHSDLFGLSVIIFQMLAVGRHPFDGANPDRAAAIKGHAHGFRRAPWLARPLSPIGLANHQLFNQPLVGLFRRSFQRRSRLIGRPAATEWIDALDDYANQLSDCRHNPLHQFHDMEQPCPWCRLEHAGKAAVFGKTTFQHSHWRDHYDAMMRLALGRYAPLVIPETYDPVLRLLPRRAWYVLGVCALLFLLRGCFSGGVAEQAPVRIVPARAPLVIPESDQLPRAVPKPVETQPATSRPSQKRRSKGQAQ